ncbi:MAG: hypothetical protein K2W96_06550 [Gemmataceae bacterium]|nr:hypothetical protein [Gemmataceae bacterium]
MPRLRVALAVSLAAHAALLPLLWLPARPAPKRASRGGPALRLTLSGWEPPRPAHVVKKEDWIPVDVVPRVGSAPAVSPVPVEPVPGSAGGGIASGVGAAPAPRDSRGSPLAPPGTARRVVWLIDRSISMGPTGGLAAARRELRAALANLPAQARFQVLLYNQGVEALQPAHDRDGLHPADPATVARLLARLDGFPASGGTNHLAALRQAVQLRPECVCLVTDAADLARSDVRDAERLLASGVRLHVIELCRHRAPPSLLAELAVRRGGTHRCVAPDS